MNLQRPRAGCNPPRFARADEVSLGRATLLKVGLPYNGTKLFPLGTVIDLLAS